MGRLQLRVRRAFFYGWRSRFVLFIDRQLEGRSIRGNLYATSFRGIAGARLRINPRKTSHDRAEICRGEARLRREVHHGRSWPSHDERSRRTRADLRFCSSAARSRSAKASATRETLPASFGRISGQGTVNFGFHGYGPHHMLRALESGLPQGFGYRESAMVVYVLLPAHVDRAAGRSPWDSKGPKYRIVRGRLQFMGPFSAGQDRIALDRVREDRSPLSRVLARSAIFRLLTRRTGLPRNEDEDRRTLIAIVAEADRLVKSQYGVPLTVLLWDVGPAYPLMHERGDQLKRELASKGIPVVALSERAPQLDELRFYFPNEGHPNGAAYAEAAQVLARWRRNR